MKISKIKFWPPIKKNRIWFKTSHYQFWHEKIQILLQVSTRKSNTNITSHLNKSQINHNTIPICDQEATCKIQNSALPSIFFIKLLSHITQLLNVANDNPHLVQHPSPISGTYFTILLLYRALSKPFSLK